MSRRKSYLNRVRVGGGALCLCTLAVAAGAASPLAQSQRSQGARQVAVQKVRDYLQAPLIFERAEVRGQGSLFLARGKDYGLGLSPSGLLLSLRHPRTDATGSARMEVTFQGGNPQPRIEGEDALPSRINYFIGNDPKRWRASLETFARVRYRRIYPGIDAVFYGRQGQLGFDFLLAPGADPASIVLDYRGGGEVKIDSRGDLLIEVAGREIRQLKPVTYQTVGGKRREVESEYRVMEGQKVAFRIGDYDTGRSLTIDPIISYSSFLGGGSSNDSGTSILIDSGMLYITGVTTSADFLSLNAERSKAPSEDAFLTKIDTSDFSVVFSTFLGGVSADRGVSVDIDAMGNIYLGGETGSFNFPTVAPTQPVRGGGVDSFIAKFDSTGTLTFSTYLGGGGSESMGQLIAAADGALTILGSTSSFRFPVTDPIQAAVAGDTDIFVTTTFPSGDVLFSTLLGGTGRDRGRGAAIDSDGSILITGDTRSGDFPMVDPLQAELNGFQDSFFARLDPSVPEVVFSSYLGGSGSESSKAVRLDSFQHVFLLGDTDSTEFPVVNAFQASNGGGSDLFAARVTPTGNALLFASYLGGTEDDFLNDAVLDGANNIFLAGSTLSGNFPVWDPAQAASGGGEDGVLVKIDPVTLSILTSSYLGGTGNDRILGLSVDEHGVIFLTGETACGDFPTSPDALFDANAGGLDPFITRISDSFVLNFAQFGDGEDDNGSIRSQLELVNQDPLRAAEVRIVIRNDEGAPFNVDLNGQMTGGELLAVVPAGGNLRLGTGVVGPLTTGTAQVFSEISVSGFIFYDVASSGATGLEASQALRSLIAPIRAGNGTNTGLALKGLGASQTLALTLRDAQGTVRRLANIDLGDFTHSARFVNEIPWDRPVDFNDFAGNLTAVGPNDFAATVILVEPGRLIILPVSELQE